MSVAKLSREQSSILYSTVNEKQKFPEAHPLDQVLPTYNLSKHNNFIPSLKKRQKKNVDSEQRIIKGLTLSKE